MERYSNYMTPEKVLMLVEHIPVAALRNEVRVELRQHPNFVLVGETGSGKTTCLGPLLVELRDELKLEGKVGITQPRRIATTSVTSRVGEMMGSNVGDRVGYHIRFDDSTSEETDLVFMTDGILLKKIQFDPLLLEFAIIMIDEAHERSLNIDLCLGLLKEVNISRAMEGIEPIRIVISSATIDRNRFAEYIGYDDTDNSVEIQGKIFPVEVFYEDRESSHYDAPIAAAKKVKQIIDVGSEGDILIFMPGKREINETVENIAKLVSSSEIEILQLHSELSPEEQNRVFETSKKRKVIISTNIAETSVTIDGIIHVIDSGLIKQNQFDHTTGIEQLVLIEHAMSGINQRMGRAGRTAPGYCHRLFTEKSLKRRQSYQTPEIQRSNLSQVILAMKKVGISDIQNFDFLDQPNRESLNHALDLLTKLGAIDNRGDITEIGNLMVDLSVEPKLARMIIEAINPDSNCLNEICILSSFLDGKNVYIRPSDPLLARKADSLHSQFRNNKESDLLALINVWQGYVDSGHSDQWAKDNYLNEKVLEEATNVRLELIDVLSSRGIKIDPRTKIKMNKEAIGKAVTAGMIGNLLRFSKGSFRKIDNTKSDIYIHPSSVLGRTNFRDGDCIVSADVFMNAEGKTYAASCMLVRQEWIEGLVPRENRQSKDKHGHKGRKRHSIFNHNSRRGR